MRRKYFLLFAVSCCLIVFLLSCGSGPGAPGSTNSEDTGIEIQSVTIAVNPNPGNSGPDLDANVHICPTTGKPEPGLFRDDATLTITASKLNPNSTFDPFPATVEQCNIVYKQPADELGAPVIEAWTIYPNCAITDGTSPCIANLIDITRKHNQFWNNVCAQMDSLGNCISFAGVNDPQKFPTRYIASYDCTYMNNMGKSGHFQVELEIFLADFELCT